VAVRAHPIGPDGYGPGHGDRPTDSDGSRRENKDNSLNQQCFAGQHLGFKFIPGVQPANSCWLWRILEFMVCGCWIGRIGSSPFYKLILESFCYPFRKCYREGRLGIYVHSLSQKHFNYKICPLLFTNGTGDHRGCNHHWSERRPRNRKIGERRGKSII
jgi:hypothetical protein